MKSTYRRLIEILSCSLAIAAVLLCSVCVPAQAASLDLIYYVWDFLSDQYEENGRLCYVFSFTDRILPYYHMADGYDYEVGYPPLIFQPNSSATYIQLHSWPLGICNWPGASCSGGVLAVSDFERCFSIELDATAYLSYTFDGQSPGFTTQFRVVSYWAMMYYDEDGNSIGQDRSEDYVHNKEFSTDSDGSADTFIELALSSNMDLNMPEGTAYFCPMLKCQLYFADGQAQSFIQFSPFTTRFSLFCDCSAIMQNTETLTRIDEKLGELNEKADTIINGTDEMQDAADKLLDDQEKLDDELDAALSELEDLEDISDELLEDQYTDFFGSIDRIPRFLVQAPWFDITNLIGPIMEFQPIVTILTMLIAFINISILFFGR